jgi:pimeloyl-ACP methyl ester carboxylesterase
MDESLHRYNYYKNLYKTHLGIDKFEVTGHSLGGGVALHIARFNPKDKAVVFNPALPVTRAMDKVSIPNSRIIRTNYDMVSRGRTAVVDGERLTVHVSDGVRNPLSAHKMDHFTDDSISRNPTLVDKVSTIYDEYAPKAFGAISIALTTAQLTGDIQNRDIESFVKHSAETAISTNPLGAVGVTAFEFGSSVARDIHAGDTSKAIKDTVEGAALSTWAFFGVPGLFVGGAVAGVTELGYRLLGHSNPHKPHSESISGTVTEPGLSLDHLGRTYAESLSGKADAAAAMGVLRG